MIPRTLMRLLDSQRQQSRPDLPSRSTSGQLDLYLNSAFRCGDLDGARSFVKSLSPQEKRQLTEDSGLMLVALKENKPEFIRFLVEECNADLEKPIVGLRVRGGVNTDTFITPLRYAARNKNTEAAVELIRLGANVNAYSPTTGSTALHDACNAGALSIVKELIQHGADLTMTNKYGCTALMHAIGHVDVCRVLIESGTNVNTTNKSGSTALHDAVGLKNTETVKLLIKSGADLFKKNIYGEDAFCCACMQHATNCLKVMREQLSDDEVGHQNLIRSHQLSGACYILYHDPTSAYSRADFALIEWEAAVRLREEKRHIFAGEDDVVSTPNSAYDDAVEVASMSKLDEMRQDANKIYMQGLLLKEKILGPTHERTIASVINLADIFMRSEDYGRGLRLLRHGFRLLCGRRLIFPKTNDYMFELRRVSMNYHGALNLHAINTRLEFKDVYEFLETVMLEARRLEPPSAEENGVTFFHGEENARFIQIILYLMKLFCHRKKNEAEIVQLKRLVREFVRFNLRSFEGRTFLMNAICPVRSNEYGRFSLEVDVIKLLVECGADTGEMDYEGNSVLHMLAKSEQLSVEARRNVPNKETSRKVAETLLAFGAHFDARNSEGASAVDYLSSLGFGLQSHMTLQCLAAHAVRRHKIPHEGILPKSLTDFVMIH